MNIIVSVPGRFHAFDLGAQLERRGHLLRLITSYPRFEVAKYGIPRDKVKSFVTKELVQRLWEKFPSAINGHMNINYSLQQWFDIFASCHLLSADIFVGWSGSSLRSLRWAKKCGMITVIERGSTHIQTQDELLREEYQRLGIPMTNKSVPDPRVIATELEEYEQADYISVPSIFVRDTFLNRGFERDKMLHNPYGTNSTLFHKTTGGDDVFRVIFAGGICIRKGVHYLLRAFSELRLPNAELWLIGPVDEDIKPFLKIYSGSYRLVGRIPQRDLHRYYSQGSVFCILSIEEGLALVQAQAMACGMPVIATKNTGAEDIIRDGQDGYIIPIRDVEACKERLVYLYEHRDICRAMGESATRRVAEGFSWDAYGDRMIHQYQRILEKRG